MVDLNALADALELDRADWRAKMIAAFRDRPTPKELSGQRLLVAEALRDLGDWQTTTAIATVLDIPTSSASGRMTELRQAGYVENGRHDDLGGRLYRLTKKGRAAI